MSAMCRGSNINRTTGGIFENAYITLAFIHVSIKGAAVLKGTDLYFKLPYL